jgi:molybdopterin-guanine dinucleotide biosynthesis protein A
VASPTDDGVSGRPFSAIVLTGGASRRMGTDKAFVELDGRPLAGRVLDALHTGGAARIVAVGGDLGRLAALGYEAMADQDPGEGPLGGILTGLGALTALGPWPAFVTACDHPGLAPELPGVLVARWSRAEGSVDAVVPVVDDVVQPLAALYAPSAAAGLAPCFASGERSVRRALGDLATVFVEDLPASWFVDVDTPGDLDHYASSDGSP